MKRIIILLLALAMLALSASSAEDLTDLSLEAFLTDLYTVETFVPVPESDKLGAARVAHIVALRSYLSDAFGEQCTPEVLEDMFAARFPFLLTEDGSTIAVKAVELEQRDPETSGEGRWFYTVTAVVTPPGGEPEAASFTGRLTQDPETGLITRLSPDVP